MARFILGERHGRAVMCAGALGLALMAGAGRVAAQPQAEADELFKKGRALYDEGKLEPACAALARSQALDPSVGTLGLLAACEEKRGLLARAYLDFTEAARLAQAGNDKRGAYASERAAALAPRVPRLVIRVDPAGPPARVTRAGQEVPRDQLGGELLVDPGAFEVVATAPDGREVRRALVAAPGQRLEVVIPAFTAVKAAPPPLVEHPVARALAFVTGGLGLVGVGVGAGFGARAVARNSASKDPAVCPRAAPTCSARDDAFTSATVSTIALPAGLVAIGASVALFVVSRPSPAVPATSGVAISVSPTGAISVSGAF